jgi:hypothetical protein
MDFVSSISKVGVIFPKQGNGSGGSRQIALGGLLGMMDER